MERKPFGHSNTVYEINLEKEELIVRMNENPQALQGTAANLQILKERGLPVPEVLFSDLTKRHFPFAYLILNKIAGRDLRYELPRMSLNQMTEVAGQIVSFQEKAGDLPLGRGFGWVPINSRGPYKSWTEVIDQHMEQYLESVRSYLSAGESDGLIDSLIEQAKAYRPYFEKVEPRCFLDDITTKNVLVEDGELQGIIDFDWVCYGDPLYMIGLTQTAIVSDVPGVHSLQYIDELCRLWPLQPEQRKVVDFYSVLHGLQFLNFLSKSGEKKAFQNVLAFIRNYLTCP